MLNANMSTINRKMRNTKNRIEYNKGSSDFFSQERAYLGSNKDTMEFRERMSDSMGRYEALRRENLFAIVLPGGHGKSTLSERYGCLDIDDLVTMEEQVFLSDFRYRMVAEKREDWIGHNTVWWGNCNDQLNMMVFDVPTVILVHTEETACELGAKVIAVGVLTENQFESNIIKRRPESKMFSRINRSTVLTRSICKVNLLNSNDEVEMMFLQACNAFDVPVACPYKYSRRMPNGCYSDSVPDWVLKGDASCCNIDDLVELYQGGHIPKHAVDYFVRKKSIPYARGFGVTVRDWNLALRMIRECEGDRRSFEMNADLMEVFPPDSEMERNRMNVTLRRLHTTMGILDRDDVVEMMCRHVGERHVFVTSIVSHWLALGQNSRIPGLSAWYNVKFEQWDKVFKELHKLFRNSCFFMDRWLHEKERQDMMYMQLLVGRKLYSVDIDVVVAERDLPGPEDICVAYDTNTSRWSREQYNKDFDEALGMAYLNIMYKPKKYNITSFLEFWKRRRSWLTKGSLVKNNIHSRQLKYIIKVLDDSVKIIERHHNKVSLSECEDMVSIMNIIWADANTTNAAPKYETGTKERALLPGTLIHYIIFSYVLNFAERQEQVGNVRLNAPEDNNIEYFESKMVDGMCHLWYDWANFNAQHSAVGMSKVVRMLSQVVDAPSDYAVFVDFIADEMFNMYISDGSSKTRIHRGLFSGWRGTTWINSVLNYVYLAMGEMNYRRLYGKSAIICSDQGGDDVDASLSDSETAFRLFSVMIRMGNDAQDSKQGVSHTSEFFRISISKRYVMGNATRALSSFVAGNWEGTGSASIDERIAALMDQISKLRRRGCSDTYCDSVMLSCLIHWCRVKDDEGWKPLSTFIIHGQKEDGGLGIPDINGNVWILESKVPRVVKEISNIVVPGRMSSTDYVGTICQELEKASVTMKRKDIFINKLAESSYDVAGILSKLDWLTIVDFQTKAIGVRPVVESKWDFTEMDEFWEWLHTRPKILWRTKYSKYVEMLGYLECNGVELTSSDICKLIYGDEVSDEVLNFKGSIDYRRLVPEYLSTYIEEYCVHLLHDLQLCIEYVKEVFEILCYMMWKIFAFTL